MKSEFIEYSTNSSYEFRTEINQLQEKTDSTKFLLCIMFVSLSFIGGLLTPLTFTEMTSKTQDNVSLENANVYLSFLSTFEVIGKFLWGLVCGSFAISLGYQQTFLIASGLQASCLACYVFSRFEK